MNFRPDGKSSQEYSVNAGDPQGSIFSPTLFLLYINDLLVKVICYADDTALYYKYDLVSNLWQQLEAACDLEAELPDTVDWGRKWLVHFNAGKTQVVLFDWSDNSGAIDVKITAQKMEFSIKNFFSKCDQIRSFRADLVTFTEETLNGTLYFLYSK